jgi:hypothetical protein
MLFHGLRFHACVIPHFWDFPLSPELMVALHLHDSSDSMIVGQLFSDPRFVCESFSPDVKTDDNVHLLDWIDVVAGRPVLIFLVHHPARAAQENRNHIFP